MLHMDSTGNPCELPHQTLCCVWELDEEKKPSLGQCSSSVINVSFTDTIKRHRNEFINCIANTKWNTPPWEN